MKMRFSAVQWMVGFEVVKKSINRPWGELPTNTVYLTPNQFHFSQVESKIRFEKVKVKVRIERERKEFERKKK